MVLFNIFKNWSWQKRMLNEMFVIFILGLSLIPIISLTAATNQPPIVDAGPDKEVFENESVILNGSASDPDGETITLSWSCPAGNLSNNSIAQPTYTAPLVDFNIYYTCILTATDSQGLRTSDTVKILVKNKIPDIMVSVLAKNLSRQDTIWKKSISASSSEEIMFKIEIVSNHNLVLENMMVKNNLASKMVYQGNLKIDNISDNRDITNQAINIGNLRPGQTKIITFQSKILSAGNFASGITELLNTALVYNANLSKTETAKILATKTTGPTAVKTGLFDIGFLNSILFPLILGLLIFWLSKSKLLALDKLIEERQKAITEYRAKKLLKKKINEIKGKF